jgi:hypothetical protein
MEPIRARDVGLPGTGRAAEVFTTDATFVGGSTVTSGDYMDTIVQSETGAWRI